MPPNCQQSSNRVWANREFAAAAEEDVEDVAEDRLRGQAQLGASSARIPLSSSAMTAAAADCRAAASPSVLDASR